MKAGVLKIDRRLLHSLLRLPETTQIIDISCDREVMGSPLKLIVIDAHERGIPEVPEGNLIPTVHARYENMDFAGYV